MSDIDGHEVIKVRSMAHLQQACNTAAKNKNYNSQDTCTRLESLFFEQSGFKLYGWQLDVVKAILFRKVGITAAAVNGDSWSPTLLKVNTKYVLYIFKSINFYI